MQIKIPTNLIWRALHYAVAA